MLSRHLQASVKEDEVSTNFAKNTDKSVEISGKCFPISFLTQLSSTKHWIMDSGASKHICSNIQFFTHTKHTTKTFVILPNQNQITVHIYGDIRLNSDLILRDVLYVPKFGFNLFSISYFIADKNLVVIFYHNSFIIQDSQFEDD